jgi:hypothetical protein
MKSLFLLVLMFLSGCVEDKKQLSKDFENVCAKPLSVTVIFNSWGNEVRLYCAEMKKAGAK